MDLFKGVYTVIVTPFKNDLSVNYNDLELLIKYQKNSGVVGIVILGTTSESPTLSIEEKQEIIKFVHKRTVNTNIKLIIGVGGNNTAEVIYLSQFCVPYCDALMITVPNYNKPSQEGIKQHFISISKKVPNTSIIMYNIPSRCGVNMEPETVKYLYENCHNIRAIKEASGSLNQAIQIINTCNIQVFSGDDALTIPIIASGGHGVISVISNLFPEQMVILKSFCLDNNYNDARELYNKLHKFIKLLFVETNPTPIKYVLYKFNLISTDNVRLPLISSTNINYKQTLVNEASKIYQLFRENRNLEFLTSSS